MSTLKEDDDLQVSKFMEILPRVLIIRYCLITDKKYEAQHFIVKILGAKGLSSVDTDFVFAAEGASFALSETKPWIFGLKVMAGEELPGLATSSIEDWQKKAENNPWWGKWLSPEPFIGVSVVKRKNAEDQVSIHPRDHELFQFFHGSLSECIESRAVNVKRAAEMDSGVSRSHLEAWELLNRRFAAFAGQSSQEHLHKLI